MTTMTTTFQDALAAKLGAFFASHILESMDYSGLGRIEARVSEFPTTLKDYLEPYTMLDREYAAHHVGARDDISDDLLFALVTECDDCLIADRESMTFVVVEND